MEARASETVLSVEDLTVSFGGLLALDGVSLAVPAGEVRGIIGPNGAGKTTLFNAITGYVVAERGTIRLGGRPISHLRTHQIAALGVRRTFQGGGLFPRLTVLENVLLGRNDQIRTGLWPTVTRARTARMEERRAVDLAMAALEGLHLSGLAERPAADLSPGQQRLVEIARVLVADTTLLLLDEPAAGLSPVEREQLGRVLQEISHTRGLALLLIEHVLELVMEVSDVVTVLNLGRTVAEGPPVSVRQDPAVVRAYLGMGEA